MGTHSHECPSVICFTPSRKSQAPEATSGLPALAHWYIDKICGGPGNTDQFSIARVHEKATGYKPAFFLEEELKARLFEKLSAVEAEQMWQMITKHTESRVRAAQCLLPATKGGTNDDTINNKRVIVVGECKVVQHNNNKRHKLDTTNSDHEDVVCFVTCDFCDEFAKTHDKSKKSKTTLIPSLRFKTKSDMEKPPLIR